LAQEPYQALSGRIEGQRAGRHKLHTTLSDEQPYILELLGRDPLIFSAPMPA
jgi:hypothetical protein